jgi:hypothetical protein
MFESPTLELGLTDTLWDCPCACSLTAELLAWAKLAVNNKTIIMAKIFVFMHLSPYGAGCPAPFD